MTNQQTATIRAQRVDSTAREMMRAGIRMTHAQADRLTLEQHGWITNRLGLWPETDDRGIIYRPDGDGIVEGK